jgi:hypothetical protein
MLTTLVSCELEPQVQISENPVAPVITAPSNNVVYNFTSANGKELVTITWAPADFGFTYTPTYEIIIDKAGNNFAKPTLLGFTTANSMDVTVTKLNTTVKKLKYGDGVPGDVEMRVEAILSAAVPRVNSNPITFKFTTYK